MVGLYQQEFNDFYEQKIKPIVAPYEKKRVSLEFKKAAAVAFGFISIMFCGYLLAKDNSLGCILLVLILIPFLYVWFLEDQFHKSFKKEITSKILLLFGNLYFSDSKNAIPYGDIKAWGLFPSSEGKTDDDVIIGLYKGCNFLINECGLYHIESRRSSYSGKARLERVYDFSGLIIKIQMKKNFTSQTFVGISGKCRKPNKLFQEVLLESIAFMRNHKVYSTDQIEARYLLTTGFMDRLCKLGDNFKYAVATVGGGLDSTNQVSSALSLADYTIGDAKDDAVAVAFVGGFVYLFVPKENDFFEVDTKRSLFDAEQYYTIYKQINSILEIIDFMKFDKNLGM